MALVHGTAVAIEGRGVLLRGPSGAGKSDLALRLIEAGAILIADDQVDVSAQQEKLIASPPLTIAGMIEIRGVGIRRLPYVSEIPLGLIVDLASSDHIERLPEFCWEALEGVRLPILNLAPFEASAPAKLFAAIQRDDVEMASDDTVGVEGVTKRTKMLIVTGMSGAGRSSALKALEDVGYEAVDNLPVSLLPRVTPSSGDQLHPVAVGVDVRTREFNAEGLVHEVERLRLEGHIDCTFVFLECDDDVLVRRYTETRRRHPLSGDRTVTDGIQLERGLLRPLRERADLVIDTSLLRAADLKRILTGNFALSSSPGLRIFVTSFSFREGLPRDADLVFDVRFLDNPHYDRELRPLTGLDQRVSSFVMADPSWDKFFNSLTNLLETLLPRYDREGKSYLTIAIGCTGGRHRSVATAEHLGQWFMGNGLTVSVGHRDIDQAKGNTMPASQRQQLPEDAALLRTLE